MLDPREISPETPRPISRAEYGQMARLGLFEGERVELLYGVIVRMSPHGPEHDAVLGRLASLLIRTLSERAHVRIQSGFAASDGSEPEPDVTVVPPRDYDHAHPVEAWLIVEVAQSSLAKDTGPKARLYAESAVEEYWVVNLEAQVVEVHTEPAQGTYQNKRVHMRSEAIRLRRFPDVVVDLRSILRGSP